MKTRFSILSVLLCLFTVNSWADTKHETTTDHITLPELTIYPGGNYITVTASVENISKYSACGLDIYLPEGYEFVQLQLENEDEEFEWMYASKGAACKTSHSCISKIQDDGALRITIYSSSSASFKNSSNELFNFFIKASSYAKPGPADIQIKNCFFTTAAGVQYDATNETISDKVSASTTGTLSVYVSGTYHYATFISPFEIPESSITGKDLKVYKYSKIDNSKAYFTSQTSIKAYKPYLLYSENEFNETFTGTINPSKYQESITDDKYVGIIVKQTATKGYVLQNHDDEGVKFYKINSEFPLNPGKCYLLPADGGSKLSFAFDEEEETDGINNINANADANTVYDLQGRKVKNPQQRGIYIENGKKVVRK